MNEITLTIEGHTGTAIVEWKPKNQWHNGRYEALITVPYKDSRWVSLWIFDEEQLTEAMENAIKCVKSALLHCGTIV